MSTGTSSSPATTIAAIATPPGSGGIGIIRMSGPLALAILQTIFRKTPTAGQDHGPIQFINRHLTHGWIINPESRLPVDEVLAVYMKAPATYTREDIVEIHCHGSYIALQTILGLILAADARPAEAGEFTKRAFLNGRIDLTRAEAVLELLNARTSEGLSMATVQLQGRLRDNIEAIRRSLVKMRAILEVAIDFPEENEDIIDHAGLLAILERDVVSPVEKLLERGNQGKIFRDGVSAVILGRPNVGKSSLLNTLLQEERALVTEIPGTTRDTIEEYISIRGIPVRIVDTAGIRQTNETVEEMGIKRAREKLAGADLVLLVIDSSQPLTSEDQELSLAVHRERPDCKLIIIRNKTDLPAAITNEEYEQTFDSVAAVDISAKHHLGIRELENVIFKLITQTGKPWDPGLDGAPNLRHQAALEKARQAARQVGDGLAAGLSADLLAIDLQETLNHLGDIIGETTTEDILDMIFEQFCIGK